MNILLVSECNKRALTETRRIIDQFAERKGERTWQTAVTLAGLNTLRKLLRKTARRNTAVACHWIKGAGQTELLWIVGNLRRFNDEGSVPTHTTECDVLKSQDENSWHSAQTIGLIAAIAGLFHDFGKASLLFQQGLKGESKTFQPYRHEWVSLRLFCAWIADRTDEQWLQALTTICADDEAGMLAHLDKDTVTSGANPFARLPPLAATIAWLILSHHRLPVYPGGETPPQLDESDSWLTCQMGPAWNALNHIKHQWQQVDLLAQWTFLQGTPMRSKTWRAKAQKIARRALAQPLLLRAISPDQRFICHMARMVLMLADHHYSSLPATPGWQDPAYLAYANTDRASHQGKQKLDEHSIGVGQNALLLGCSLPCLRKTLPAITRHKAFRQRVTHAHFRWQDRAYDLTAALRERTDSQGFFGVNMASTGCGKTFANARIMYALADEKRGCRFSIALGLRTLTLQTGEAIRDRLHLTDEDLAVMIGSQAVKDLHQQQAHDDKNFHAGSESEEALFYQHQYVRYDGSLDDGRLSRWLQNKDKLNRLLSAPVLVSTIDYLIPATEGLRGGKQIAPMLRLLTSDLVLDEPDDFDINDLSALCRLVNWAGMLGSRVLISSATLPPALVLALYNAYRHGRAEWHKNTGLGETTPEVCCAWYDEHSAVHKDVGSGSDFRKQHDAFVASRVAQSGHAKVLRRGELVPVMPANRKSVAVLDAMAAVFHRSMQQLHFLHHQQHKVSGKKISLGIIRMANINPLVAIAQRLLTTPAADNMHIHYCVYHSQHPLAMRSHIEQRLDKTLNRHNPEALWEISEIKSALANSEAQHHLFVVLSTAVSEVGRDFDLDWAIAEPSSMRAVIQLAGRVQRHRQHEPGSPNIHLLEQNFKALRSPDPKRAAYCQPGFESSDFLLASHNLRALLTESQYQVITANPRVQEREERDSRRPFTNFVDLEHVRLRTELQGKNQASADYCAALWWRKPVSWCGELQRLRPFRPSSPDELHYLLITEEGEAGKFFHLDEGTDGRKPSSIHYPGLPPFAKGISAWMTSDYQQVYARLADQMGMELSEISEKFGEIRLRKTKETEVEMWHFHPLLGVFGALD